jgi:hypothetical protein
MMDITKQLNKVDVALLKPKFHEALDILYEALEDETNGQFRAYLITFGVPRKVYHANEMEQHTLTMAHMSGLLSASDTGSDERGEYQVFSLTASGRQLVEQG